jgi:hypothetical protein
VLSVLGAATVALCAILAIGPSPRPSSDAQAGPTVPVDLGPADSAYRELFTPSSSPPGTFAVYRSAEGIQSLATRFRALDPTPAAGAWDVERTGVFDAFGAEGPYDKGRLVRLFGGSSPRAARGSLVTPQGRIAVALISPYPDLAITSLQEGTLVIVTRLPVGRVQRGPVPITGRPPSPRRTSFRIHRAITEFEEEPRFQFTGRPQLHRGNAPCDSILSPNLPVNELLISPGLPTSL